MRLTGFFFLLSSLFSQVQYNHPELDWQTIETKNFSKRIAFNVIPQIDKFTDDGSTKEEVKMINETKKILDVSIEVSATCVRVPVFIGHAESVNVEFENNVNIDEIREILGDASGVS